MSQFNKNYTELIQQKAAMEAKLVKLSANIDAIKSDIETVNALIDVIVKKYPDVKEAPADNTHVKQTWGTKIRSILDNKPQGLLFGDIVNAILDQGLDEELPKLDVQRRVMSQLYYMVKHNHAKKTKSENGMKYVLMS